MKPEATNIGERFWRGVWFALPFGIAIWVVVVIVLML